MDLSDYILLIPASGFSRRFGEDDKLLADLEGRPLASWAVQKLGGLNWKQKLAVIPIGQLARETLFIEAGFEIIRNPHPEKGQGYSLALGAKAAGEGAIVVTLADMPFVPISHFKTLTETPGETVVTLHEGRFQPPTVIRAAARKKLEALTGDRGLRPDGDVGFVPLTEPLGMDVDTPEAMKIAIETARGLHGRGAS